MEKLSVLGIAALEPHQSEKVSASRKYCSTHLTVDNSFFAIAITHTQFTNISTEMEKIYSSATVCLNLNGTQKCGLELDPDLSNLMAKSRDFDQLRDVWLRWRDSAGRPIRSLYRGKVHFEV